MGDYALYQAIKSYTSSSDDELQFQKGDVFQISVESPFATRHTRRPGWLFAYNRRTRAVGYVPVECVKLLGSEIGKTIHHPSACGVEVANNKLETENKLPEHKLEDVYFLTPILCKLCKDYIWGQGHIGVKCKGKLHLPVPVHIKKKCHICKNVRDVLNKKMYFFCLHCIHTHMS